MQVLIKIRGVAFFTTYSNPKSVSITGSQALSLGINVPRLCLAKIEAEPPDLRYQALPGNE